MKKFCVFYLLIITLFFLIGCSVDYQCKIDKEIQPTIHVIGNSEKAKVIVEYNLGPLYMLDQLKDITPVDAFFFSQREGKFNSVRMNLTLDNYGFSNSGVHYTFDGKEYTGTEPPRLDYLFEHRLELVDVKWTIYDEKEFETGAPMEILKNEKIEKVDEIKEKKEKAIEQEENQKPSTKGKI